MNYRIRFIGKYDNRLTNAVRVIDAIDLNDAIAKATGMMNSEAATHVKDSVMNTDLPVNDDDVVWLEFVIRNNDDGIVLYYSDSHKNDWLKRMKEVSSAHK